MEKRVELEMRGKQPSEVLELNLDNCRATQIAGITDEFKNLEYLSLINVGLTTLKGFPKLPNLKRLDLSDNRLAGGLDNLAGAENITHLNLSGNKIKDLDAINPLTKFSKLKSLDMFNCEITQNEKYREKVFELLPNLKYLDGFDKEEKECEESDDDLDEDELDNDEEDGDEDDEDCGLEYLQSSKAAQDEDETEDFEPGADGEHDEDDDDEDDEADEEEESSGQISRGTKRKLEDDSN